MSLKQYEILGKLGSGSYGIVYKARKKNSEEVCVIKEVDISKMDRKLREWSLNQAKLMKNINSEYIVKYYDSFTEQGKFFICMEYCKGGDLAYFLKMQKGKPINEETIWRFALQIMVGLRDIHAKKVLHRDIKSMNVFLTEDKVIRIGDLGVARTMTRDFATTIVGTPYYLSPQMCEEKPYNEKTDVWAFGCLVYELCTGRHPFEANSQAALALKIVVGKYTPLPKHYSSAISWLVKLCLSVDYKRRPTMGYLLNQTEVINKAKQIGVTISGTQFNKVQEKKLPEKKQAVNVRDNRPIVPVEQKPLSRQKKPAEIQPKMNYLRKGEAQRKASVERNRSRSTDRSKEQASRQVKKEVKPSVPPKKYSVPAMPRKSIGDVSRGSLEEKEVKKWNKPAPSPKVQHKKEIAFPKVIDNEKKLEQPKKQQAEASHLKGTNLMQDINSFGKEETLLLQPQSKKVESIPKKKAQELVDDNELNEMFGITPEKITMMEQQQKMDFKKINSIYWEVCNEKEEKSEPKNNGQKLSFLPEVEEEPNSLSATNGLEELPTIKTPSGCEMVRVESKDIDDDDEDLVAQQIDDNAPFKSDDENSFTMSEEGDELLVQNFDDIEEEKELKRKETISTLERKIVENEKRKKELVRTKQQQEKDILVKLQPSKLQQIKRVVRQGTDEQIERYAFKQLKQGKIVAFYKILHYDAQIDRCNENIEQCKSRLAAIDK